LKHPRDLLEFADASAWRAWLEAHHATRADVWLRLFKARHRHRGLGLDQAVEEALCFGWIDSSPRARDEESFLLRFSPRRPCSVWSARNVERVERLIREGRMTAAGLARVEEAKRNGQWSAALVREEPDRLPEELRKALASSQGARAGFRALSPSRRKQLLLWFETARRPATRARRLRAIVREALGEGGRGRG
jgi:uncharacterized protein YdeI (YjbR/CyaY-like superfamily)